MFDELVAWLLSFEGWQLLIIFIVLTIAVLPIFLFVFSRLFGYIRTLFTKKTTVKKYSENYFGMDRAANDFHGETLSFFQGKSRVYNDPLYVILSQDLDQTIISLEQCGMRNKHKKIWSSGNLAWAAYEGGNVAIVSEKVWSSDSARWNALLKILRKHRPERPIDGVIVDIAIQSNFSRPMDEVKEGAESETTVLQVLKERFYSLQTELRMTFPTYFLFTGAEKIKGFSSASRALSLQGCSTIGFSRQSDPSAFKSLDRIGLKILEMATSFDSLAFSSLQNKPNMDQNDEEIFLFSNEFSNRVDRLTESIGNVFPFNQAGYGGEIRGIFFTGKVSNSLNSQGFLKNPLQQSIFPEANIAEPLSTSLSNSTRNVKVAQLSLAAVLLCGVISSVAQQYLLTDRVPKIIASLNSLITELEEMARSNSQSGTNLQDISKRSMFQLDILTGFDPNYITTFWIPASYLTEVQKDLNNIKAIADRKLLLDPVKIALSGKIRALSSISDIQADLDKQAVQLDLQSMEYPNFLNLHLALDEFYKLNDMVNSYSQIQKGTFDRNQFNNLVDYLFGTRLPRSYRPTLETISLTGVKIGMDDLASNDLLGSIDERWDYELKNIAYDMMARDAIIQKLQRFSILLSSDADNFSGGENSLSRLIEIKRLGTELATLIESGRYEWLVSSQQMENINWVSLLDRVDNNPLLGKTYSQDILNKVYILRQRVNVEIVKISLQTGIKVLETDNKKINLNKTIENAIYFVSDALDLSEISKSTLVQSSKGDVAIRKIEFSDNYKWNIKSLTNLNQELQFLNKLSFQAAPFVEIENLLTKTLNSSARDTYLSYLPKLVQPVANTGLFARKNTDEISSNFNLALPELRLLNQLMINFGQENISDIIKNQIKLKSERIISETARLVKQAKYFNVDVRQIDHWDGKSDLRHVLFGNKTNTNFSLMIDKQVHSLSNLVLDAAMPSIEVAFEHKLDLSLETNEEMNRLSAIAASLIGLSEAEPTSTAYVMIDFLENQLPTITSFNCSLPMSLYSSFQEDFFISKLLTILGRIEQRCNQINENNIDNQYEKFAKFFNEKVSNKYPFSGDYKASAVTLETIVELMERSQDLQRLGLMSLDYYNKSKSEDVELFLSDLDDTISFFARIQIGSAEEPTGITTKVNFRVARDQEVGANKVASWQMKVGETTIDQYSADNSLNWQIGNPVDIKLRWAKGSSARPQAGFNDGNYLLASNDAVRIYLDDQWSLIRLIQIYSDKNITCSANEVHCLELEVPIEFTSANSAASLKGGLMKGFISIEISDDMGKINIPHFPRRAPLSAGTGN